GSRVNSMKVEIVKPFAKLRDTLGKRTSIAFSAERSKGWLACQGICGRGHKTFVQKMRVWIGSLRQSVGRAIGGAPARLNTPALEGNLWRASNAGKAITYLMTFYRNRCGCLIYVPQLQP
ncbi:MAG TPA: hypothetical protein VGV15_18795, partial [Terriglobales bacterium]|nr:hypothetical protein [Terriglobales bacterium]